MSKCKQCDGRGFLSAYASRVDAEPCDECGGSGNVRSSKCKHCGQTGDWHRYIDLRCPSEKGASGWGRTRFTNTEG